MKALSLKQPYAGFVESGEKSIEFCSWKTDYRGPLLICSSGESALAKPQDPFECAVYEADFPESMALCVVDLLEILPFSTEEAALEEVSALAECAGEFSFCRLSGTEFSPRDFKFQGYLWFIENPRPIERFSVTAGKGLFEVPVPREEELREAFCVD